MHPKDTIAELLLLSKKHHQSYSRDELQELIEDEEINNKDIRRLVEAGGKKHHLDAYAPKFKKSDAIELMVSGVTTTKAIRCMSDSRFTHSVSTSLDSEIITGDPSRCKQPTTTERILYLVRNNIPFDFFEQLSKQFSFQDVLDLYRLKFDPSHCPIEDQERLYPVFRQFIDQAYNRNEDISLSMTINDMFCYLGAGYSSIVILAQLHHYAYKFSTDISNERSLLLRLQKGNERGGTQKNVVQLRKVITGLHRTADLRRDLPSLENHFRADILRLEYIKGKTVEQIMNSREQPFSPAQTVTYASQIFNGLLELREAGIYHHRDLRPANIVIDEEEENAIIIDLGIATTDKEALSKDNRRYGSTSRRRANDLNSLGQVMYKMTTGKHIFAESKSMEKTVYAQDLKDHRDWIYGNPKERLQAYLEQVDRTVEDDQLAEIIKFCLNSQGTDQDYQTLARRFADASGFRKN